LAVLRKGIPSPPQVDSEIVLIDSFVVIQCANRLQPVNDSSLECEKTLLTVRATVFLVATGGLPRLLHRSAVGNSAREKQLLVRKIEKKTVSIGAEGGVQIFAGVVLGLALTVLYVAEDISSDQCDGSGGTTVRCGQSGRVIRTNRYLSVEKEQACRERRGPTAHPMPGKLPLIHRWIAVFFF